PLRFPPKGRRAPQRLFPSRREPHRRLAPVLRRSRPDQAKLFERLDVAPDRRAVQFRDPSEPGQGNRSGALDLSQETVLGERHPRGLEDRIVERGRLSRRAPDRGAIADGLHIAGIYPHRAGIASGAFAGAKPRPPRTPPAKLGSARTAAATSDRASLRPLGRPSGRRDALDGLWFGAMQIFDANYLVEIRTWSYVILIRRMEPPRARLAGRTDWRTAFVLLRLAWRKKFFACNPLNSPDSTK